MCSLAKPEGSITLIAGLRLNKLKECRCCNMIWMYTAEESVVSEGLLYFNCSCGSTLAIKVQEFAKGFSNEAI